MLAIPAIDLMGGKVVRLLKGAFDSVTEYGDDPVEMAKRLLDIGAKRIHIVDLDAARRKTLSDIKLIGTLASSVHNKATIQVGGGIYNLETAEALLSAGASNIVIGSLLFENNDLFMKLINRFGEKIILALDIKEGTIRRNGWRTDTRITIEEILKEEWIKQVHSIMVTDISVDGSMAGPNIDLMERLVSNYPLKWIASGGVHSDEDLMKLDQIGVYGAIIGKAIYEGKITDLRKYEVNR